MPFTITIDDSAGTYTCVSDEQIPSDTNILDFIGELQTFNEVVPMDSFTFNRTSNGSDPVYDYKFTAKDGRIWDQVLKLEGSQNSEATMNFSVADFWRLSEFALQRPIRDRIVGWASMFKVVTINYTWK